MVEIILILSIGLNILQVLVLVGYIKRTNREKQKLVNYGEVLAYQEILKSLRKLVGDN